MPAGSSRSSTTAPARSTPSSSRSSASPPRPSCRRQRTASGQPRADAAPQEHQPHPLEGTMSTAERLADLSAAGVSIWLDDLSRERIESGNLADLVENKHV